MSRPPLAQLHSVLQVLVFSLRHTFNSLCAVLPGTSAFEGFHTQGCINALDQLTVPHPCPYRLVFTCSGDHRPKESTRGFRILAATAFQTHLAGTVTV